MSTQNTSDEVSFDELGGVFKKFYHFFLIHLYRIFRFFVKSWIILLALIIIGGVIGYFQTKNKVYPKKAELLIQINYKGANFVYEAIELLSKKLNENDPAFFTENNLSKDDFAGLRKVEIEPVINLNEILHELPDYSRSFEVLLEETETTDELLASELFRSQYRIHKMTIKTSDSGNKATIQAVIDFLNNHSAFRDTKDIYVQNLNNQIKETAFSISRVDSIFNKLGALSNSKGSASQVYVNTQDNSMDELHLLLQEKSRLLSYLDQLKIDQVNYEQPVVLKSQAALTPERGVFSNRMIWLPILLIFLFSGLSLLRHLINKGKTLAAQE